MTEDIIIQAEPEKRDKNQISEKKFQNLSDSELKNLQSVRFRNKKFYNASDIELKLFSVRQTFN